MGIELICDRCKKKWQIPSIRGDGLCEKHGRYWAGWVNQPCPSCAKENSLCKRCGKKLTNISEK